MVTIGISTYNRKDTLVKMAKSLHESELPVKRNVRVYDDASSEYSEVFLRELFPEAVSIVRHDANIGADKNMKYMYEDYLQTEDSFFFNADSDLIFRRDWLRVLLDLIKYTDGILSAFNTSATETLDGVLRVNSYNLIEKKVLGAAGVLFSHDCIETIVKKNITGTIGTFDIIWSDIFRKKGKTLWAVEESVVQHIGVSGFNSDGERFVYGNGFRVDSISNGQTINDVLLDISERTQKNKSKMKLSVFPFSEVRQNSKVVIYGAGLFGRQYLKQVELTKYCEVVAVADSNFENMDGVVDPASIDKFIFDYIVIAINNPIVTQEIKNSLCENGVPKEKIIGNSSSRVIRLS